MAFYYPNIIVGAFIWYWIGSIVARDTKTIRYICITLACLGSLLAVHTIIQASTGFFLFPSPRPTHFSLSVSIYKMWGTNFYRAGSFFVDPNWNGTFLALILFIPIGLFMTGSLKNAKVLYLAETALIVVALLFTYSNGAWVATAGGAIVFIILVGRTRYRLFFLAGTLVALAVLFLVFHSQVNALYHHLVGPNELSLRIAVWETGLRVIAAYPLTGVGLGLQAYLERSVPYMVLPQPNPLSHPHDSYLELGAMGGLPLLVVFLSLLSYTLWKALRNWKLASISSRPLLAGGITAIIALSINSISINGWTLPPLAAMGWLLLGMFSSPLLAKTLASEQEGSTQEIADTSGETNTIPKEESTVAASVTRSFEISV
jgi:O-antigen ligase